MAPHQSWADFDPSTRSRASLSMWRYVSGELPRLPDTAVEAYSKMVNQPAFLCGTNSKNSTAPFRGRSALTPRCSHNHCAPTHGAGYGPTDLHAELQRELTQLRSTVDTLNDKVDENNRLLRKLYCSPCVSMAVPWRKRRIWGGLEQHTAATRVPKRRRVDQEALPPYQGRGRRRRGAPPASRLTGYE